MKLISWNVNGLRAVEKKGFVEWLEQSGADAVCLNEIKADKSQLSDALLNVKGYAAHFMPAQKKGYSGVGIYTKLKPLDIEPLGASEFDDEGRTIIAHFDDFSLLVCYFPNSQEKGARLDYKLAFCDAVLEKCNALTSAGRNVILCGDYNIAHTPIDLANPEQNHKNPGFLPEEREWMSKFLASGYRDVFRETHPGEAGHYTWWSYRFDSRSKGIGWRIDYFCVNEAFAPRVKSASILSDVYGSDHCPVSLEF